MVSLINEEGLEIFNINRLSGRVDLSQDNNEGAGDHKPKASVELLVRGTAKNIGRLRERFLVAANELAIDIGFQKPEPVEKYLNKSFDYVITVCDGAKEICPVFTGDVKSRLHIGFEDPASAKGTEEEVLPVYRKVRDQIKERFQNFYSTTK